MTAKNRYWDHERCTWIVHEPTTLASPEALDEALPGQRAEEEPAPAAAAPVAAAPVATA
jgi:hypothetical protein